MTFAETLSSVYEIVNRGEDAIDTFAKRAVNTACEELHRNVDLVYSYKQASGTYTANSVSVPFSTLITPDKALSIHLVETESGSIIRLVDFPTLQNEIRKYQALTASGNPSQTSRSAEVASVLGTSLKLFPTPTTALPLFLTYKPILPLLTDDTDTNYLLTYLPSVVISKAIVNLALQLKDAELYELYNTELTTVMDNMKQWNSSLSKDKLETA